MKKAAVITAEGIGDGLVMMIGSEQLKRAGFQVTSFIGRMEGINAWFPGHFLTKEPPLLEELQACDLVILQHHNQPLAKALWQQREQGCLPQLKIIYQSHRPSYYPPATDCDRCFDPQKTMVQNMAQTMSLWLNTPLSVSNGISVPPSLTYRKYPQRIILHPSSSYTPKNWLAHRFIAFARKLKKEGFFPCFAVSIEEREKWRQIIPEPFEVPLFATLSEFAAYLYESGFHVGNDSGNGHLASNLGIPSLTIAQQKKHMQLWKPGWSRNKVVTPHRFLPNIKGFRMRERFWKYLITPSYVFNEFIKFSKN